MGILRKLIQWREKSDGTLEGPALSTEGAIINGQQSDYHWERIAQFEIESGDGETVIVNDFEVDKPYFVSVEYLSDSDGPENISLELEFGGMSDGEYDYIESTIDRQFNPVTGDDSFPLLDLDMSSEFGKCAGVWIDNQNLADVSLSGKQGGARRLSISNSTYLVSTTSDNRPDRPTDDMIFNLNTTGTGTSAEFEVYQREGI